MPFTKIELIFDINHIQIMGSAFKKRRRQAEKIWTIIHKLTKKNMNINRRDFLKGLAVGAFTAESGREIITKTYELSQNDPEREKVISQIAETFRLEASQVESIVKIVGETTTKISAETPNSVVTFFYEDGVIKVMGEIKKDPEKDVPSKKSDNNKIRS